MCMLQKQEKPKFSTKKLRNFVAILSLLEITSSYAEAVIKCNEEDLGPIGNLTRIMKKKDMVAQESLEVIKENALGSGSFLSKAKFSLTRTIQHIRGENVLEIQNNNSKSLTVTLVDQNPDFFTQLGTVNAHSSKKFALDRDTLYESYSIEGCLGLGRESTCNGLSFKDFYIKVVFESKSFGTTAHIEKTAHIY